MKRNLDYYSHDCTSHTERGFRYLRSKYGWAGEGKFYALKNLIGNSDGCKLDLTEEFDIGYYADILDFKLDEFKEYLEFIEKKCKLIKRVDNFIIIDDLLENLAQVMKGRKYAAKRREESVDVPAKSSNYLRKLA